MVSPLNNSALRGLVLGVPQTVSEQDLGQEDFLHLMVTQLKNQDPFKPLESGEFLGQLAQFGTVSGLAGLQTSFDSLAASLVSNQALQASTLVGRAALAATSTLARATGEAASGAVDLPATTSGVTVTVRDAAGQPVRTLNLGGARGVHLGRLDRRGCPTAAGHYTFTAAYDLGQGSVAAETLLRAPIDSVLFGPDGFNVELRGIGELPFTAIREIRNEPVAGASTAAGATP